MESTGRHASHAFGKQTKLDQRWIESTTKGAYIYLYYGLTLFHSSVLELSGSMLCHTAFRFYSNALICLFLAFSIYLLPIQTDTMDSNDLNANENAVYF